MIAVTVWNYLVAKLVFSVAGNVTDLFISDLLFSQVGAAISMTYTTGQPIVFVGTGQTYNDLRSLNVNSVVKALLKS